MVDIAKYASPRTREQEWAKHLRFLEIDSREDSTRSNYLDSTSGASWRPSVHQYLSLSLRERSQSTITPRYVAISYCWYRPNVSWFTDREMPDIIVVTANGKVNKSPEPVDVLHRASAYALRHGMNRIWIDQYCIDQADQLDKQVGIQAMDNVYQHSSHPIAILESFIETQDQLNALAKLFTGKELQVHEIEDLEETLCELSEDAWFTRAWTLQESTSAGSSMMLLIGCSLDLDKPEELGTTPGEIEVSIWDFQNAMVQARILMEEFMNGGVLEDESSAVAVSNYADELFNSFPFITPEALQRSSADRQVCTAAEAVNYLQNRQNTVYSDRLAIVGNLCNYEIRLKGDALDRPEYSFSTCVLTLAILNGDSSLLGLYTDPYERSYLARDGKNSIGFETNATDSAFHSHGFSWGPVPTGSLRNIEYFDQHDEKFQLRPCLLSPSGLKVSGLLWCMDHRIFLPKTRDKFTTDWDSELKFLDKTSLAPEEAEERLDYIFRSFIWHLLHELMSLGYRELTITLWKQYQPRKRQDSTIHGRKGAHLYTFEEVFESEPHAREQDIIFNLAAQDILSGSNPGSQYRSLHWTLMEQVRNSGALLCSSPITTDGGKEPPRVVFEACKEGDLVFTPHTDLGDRACTESVYRNQGMSWKVEHTGVMAEGCGILHCWGRRRGVYRMQGLVPKDYILE